GIEHCVGGFIVCTGDVGPVTETCDGLDNDCDGAVDDSVPGTGTSCGIDTGECSFGTIQCVGGTMTCQGGTEPVAEVCDGLDNDCDGTDDDGDPGGGASCGDGTGECTPGTEHCTSGSITCTGYVGPTAEVCDGLDNDCDGTADNGNPGGGAACGISTGECSQGVEACTGGAIVCTGFVGPTTEACDGLDNDCDGSVDEDWLFDWDMDNCGGCGVRCRDTVSTHAIVICNVGSCEVVGCDPDWWPGPAQGCTSGPACCTYNCVYSGTELCDGEDNDCDTLVDTADSDMATVPNFCESAGECAGASPVCTTRCGSTNWFCNYGPSVTLNASDCTSIDPEPGSVTPSCDNLDNDCDGAVDEHFPLKGTVCSEGIGACRDTGVYVCDGPGASLECNAVPASPGSETCNGLDDDCDGAVDDFGPTDYSIIGAVNVSGMWIFQHEASKPDASSCDPGTETYDGGGLLESKACSRSGVQPWTNVSWTDARRACQNLGAGWDLCTAPEWENICETSLNWNYPYSDTYVSNWCNGNDFDTDCPCGPPCLPAGDNDEVLDTGSRPSCTSTWGSTDVFDLSGNVKEWTGTWVTGGYYEIRGGSQNVPEGGLTCQFDFVIGDPTFTFFNLGFRCCHP
ncbi:MAG: SUMF1/EgtB/PvdO family nonheme iron enzyme, partial [Deltaproteobacteria bacterium]|nr:SUMF1/EgtB/PvdO family nonheme iron enzyme [Deltaproteobacteria bacterium]